MDAVKRRAAARAQDLDVAHLPEALLRVETVAALAGCSPRTIWRLAYEGKFPRPRRWGHRMTRWRAGDVTDWLRLRSAGQPWPVKRLEAGAQG